MDQIKRDELLKHGEFVQVRRNSSFLSKVWLENVENTEITKQMEHYILRGVVWNK